MNLLLVEIHECVDGIARLDDRRAEHLRKVLKVEVGQELRIGVVDGGQGRGRVRAIVDREIEIEVPAHLLPSSQEQSSHGQASVIDLIVGLPRPQALHRVLQTVACMGVGRLDLTNAWRVEKSFFSSPSLREESIRRHLLLGAEQGMTTRLPVVHQQKLLVPFLRGLHHASPESGTRLLAHPEAALTIEQALLRKPDPKSWADPILLAIGPEGGWIDREVETFSEEGFLPVSLGAPILRVENAVTAALAQVELLRRLA